MIYGASNMAHWGNARPRSWTGKFRFTGYSTWNPRTGCWIYFKGRSFLQIPNPLLCRQEFCRRNIPSCSSDDVLCTPWKTEKNVNALRECLKRKICHKVIFSIIRHIFYYWKCGWIWFSPDKIRTQNMKHWNPHASVVRYSLVTIGLYIYIFVYIILISYIILLLLQLWQMIIMMIVPV